MTPSADISTLPLATEVGWLRESVDDGGARRPYLVFRLADDDYAIELLRLGEILKSRPVTEVPRIPDFVAGVISVRGLVMPVIDLKRRLGVASVRPATRFLVVSRRDERFVLIVDSVLDVTALTDGEIEPCTAIRGEGEHIAALGRPADQPGRLLRLLDLDGVLDFDVRAQRPPAWRPGGDR